jgi:hypothetical protein
MQPSVEMRYAFETNVDWCPSGRRDLVSSPGQWRRSCCVPSLAEAARACAPLTDPGSREIRRRVTDIASYPDSAADRLSRRAIS